MIIIGLTGSIGMGKSTAASMLRRLGVPVHDADAEVHCLIGPGGAAVGAVEQEFPGVAKNGAVDRGLLGKHVFGDPIALKKLEAILHPLVAKRKHIFLCDGARRGVRVVALDVPLLFETGGNAKCDVTIVVTASSLIQTQRVLRRPGMSRRRLIEIRAQQMSEHEKCRRADFVVPTGLGRNVTLRALAHIVRLMRSKRGRHWPTNAYRKKGYARNCT